MNWEVWDGREVIATTSTLIAARTACRDASGRYLTIYSPTGQITEIWRDGQPLDLSP